MSVGDSRHLTDEQWLVLMKIVSDEKEIQLTFPTGPGEPTVLLRDGIRYTIRADGSYSYVERL